MNWKFRLYDLGPTQIVNSTDVGVQMHMNFSPAEPPSNMNFDFTGTNGTAPSGDGYMPSQTKSGNYGYAKHQVTFFGLGDTIRVTEQRKFPLDVYNGTYQVLDGTAYMPSWDKRAALVLQNINDPLIYFVLVKEEKIGWLRTTDGGLVHPQYYVKGGEPKNIAVDENGYAEELDSLGNPAIFIHEEITPDMIEEISQEQNIVLD
jgi:hypothetical protein